MSITAQQINTLLHYLETKQSPPFDILFWSALQKIAFDYTPSSLDKLQQLFSQLAARGYHADQLLDKVGGNPFFLLIAGYLGEYLARATDEPIEWYDYHEASAEIDKQNQQHHTQFRLPAQFESSVVARIGATMYCQPLKVIPALLSGETVLHEFIDAMRTAIFHQAQVNLLDEPNQVASHYLALVKTGRLLNTQIAFFDELSKVTFDYSQASLVSIDETLTQIKQRYDFDGTQYMVQISQPSVQAFLYLLGFYIGMTSSRLANVAVKWASYDQMVSMLEDSQFINCIEHSFVLLMENHYRTPILVVTNRLFEVAPQFPSTAVEFANIVEQQNREALTIFYPHALPAIENAETLPTLWRYAIQFAARLLDSHLTAISAGHSLSPQLYQGIVDTQTNRVKGNITPLANTDDATLDNLYQTLAVGEDKVLQVASFELFANLPTGRREALIAEIRVYQAPTLDLQLILPYRAAQHGDEFAIYPMVNNQTPLPNQAHELVKLLYQYLYRIKDNQAGENWQAYMVQGFEPWAITPHQAEQRAVRHQLTDAIDIPMLPLQPIEPERLTTTGLNLEVPAFDYTAHRWQGYDLPKYILEVPEAEREYLQVLAPDSLIQDELFSQAEAVTNLYRRGKVVWAVIVKADVTLYQPERNLVADKSSQILTAEVLYDPSGQASVKDLLQQAQLLFNLIDKDTNQLPPDQAFYAMHLQDSRSRLFDYTYPRSLGENGYRLSSVWVWRLHLPNGMLSDRVVPIIIHPESQGRVMILPAKFWPSEYYQHWLGIARQQFGEADGFDLMPTIQWQAQQGLQYANKDLEPRLFPKFKFSQTLPNVNDRQPMSVTQASANIAMPSSAIQTPMTVPIEQTTIPSDVIETLAKPAAASPSQSITSLTPQLQQKLLQDQARLQAALSTTDATKQKKLYLIIGVVAMVVALAWLIARFIN